MASTQPLPGRCGAGLRKKPGQFCTERPAKGGANGRCRFHGAFAGPPANGVPQKVLKSASYEERVQQFMAQGDSRDFERILAESRAAASYVREIIEEAQQSAGLVSVDALVAATTREEVQAILDKRAADTVLTLKAAAQLDTNAAILAQIAKRESEIAIAHQEIKRGDLELALTELPLSFIDVLTTVCEAKGLETESIREFVARVWSERMSRANSPLLRAAALPVA